MQAEKIDLIRALARLWLCSRGETMKLSFRNQLSLWVGLASLVIVFSTIFVTQQITVWSLENSLDENIQKRAYMVAAIISSDITTDEASYARVINDLASQELSFVSSQLRVISPSGKPIVEFGKMTDPTIQQLDYYLQASDVIKGISVHSSYLELIL